MKMLKMLVIGFGLLICAGCGHTITVKNEGFDQIVITNGMVFRHTWRYYDGYTFVSNAVPQ
jgi:hypothetical protein